MRTLTLARMGRALLLAAAVIMLPQLASAQLPVETRALKLQGSSSGSVTLDAPATIGTPYVITLPDAAPDGAGALIYATGTGADLAWTSTSGIGDGFYPRWDVNGGGAGIGAIVWTDPSGEDNPNWSLTGNALAATGKLGTTTLQQVDFITSNVVRMSIAVNGKVTISDSTDIDGFVQINSTGSDATNIGTGATAGAVTIGRTSGTLTTIGSLDHTGTSTFDGAVTLEASSPLITGATATAGTAGYVLTSAGGSASPEWESITEAVGIRTSGNISVSPAAVKTSTIAVTDLAATDAIIITTEQSGDGTSVVVPMVTNRTNGASGTFTVTFSGSFAGTVNYMVIKQP